MKIENSDDPNTGLNIQMEDLEVLRVIGRGKSSTVRTAKDCQSGQVFALKQFKTYPSAMNDLQNEVNALENIQHDNVVKMIAFDKKTVLLEYLPNGELFDVISKKKMTERVAKFYFQELINAVRHIHENGFVHRDIKLENILVSEDLHLKLADFGFASKYTEGQLFEKCLGTEGYMAPELQSRQKYSGNGVDIFACGVVLFSMVNGMPPFFKAVQSDPYFKYFVENDTEKYWNNLAKKYNNQLSDEFKDLISKMLAYQFESRITIDEIFTHPWLQDQTCCHEEAANFVREAISTNN